VAISAGASHSLALKSNGSLWEWGTIVGDPSSAGTTIADAPIRVGSDTNWVAISAGDTHSLALKSDGSLWAWGDNLWGRLGDGTSTTRGLPVRIGSDADWVSIAAGYSQSLAQKRDGSVWAWGEDIGRSPEKVLAALDGP
jgi:alpha-tubulin suppressor-like RCC1 family protein